MLELVGPPDSATIGPGWQKRLTFVTTTPRTTSGRFPSAGMIISAERLLGVDIGCPRCDVPAATLWRRFDYFGPELPLYFTKCRRCHRRRPIDADEAAFRLLEAGVIDPPALLHDGMPAANRDSSAPVPVNGAEQLVANRQRAFGRRHPLTFAARAQLGESVGKSGDPEGAARVFDQLLVDQVAAAGHRSPAVLANRYRAAVWTAYAGQSSQALEALRALLADQEETLDPDHANTLITRATIAQLIDATGDRDGAIEMLKQVGKDELRVLGSEHPATEATRQLLAEWEGR
jgi:hypothetical protein